MRKEALDLVKDYKMGPIYTPPVLSKEPGPVGTLTLGPATGGTNWPGGSFNPENHTVYVYACNSCSRTYGLVPPPPGMTDLEYVEGHAGDRVVMINAAGAGQGADAPLKPAAATPAPPRPTPPRSTTVRPGLTVQGLPLVKPPYATISAIDLDSGRSCGRSPMARRRTISGTVRR